LDKELIRHYTNLMNYFSVILGPSYEFVLHVLDPDGGSHIAHIINGELSGRNLGAPLTDYARQLINEKVYLEKDFVANYRSKGANGKEFRSSTLFIKGEDNELLGLLCVNFDADHHYHLAKEVLKLAQLDVSTQDLKKATEKEKPIENLTINIQDMIYSLVDKNILESGAKLSQEQKISIISKLKEQGIFNIKGAVVDVANTLGVSVASVYRYLQMINHSEKKQLR